MTRSKQSFTLLEIMVALGIFAVGISLLLDQRNYSLKKSYDAIQLAKAQHVIDEILADYRLHPFSTEAKAIEKDYSPFVVKVDVQEESINIIPEDWRLDTTLLDDDKKKRVILRVNVDVGYSNFDSDKVDHHLEVSTLIRLIELEEDDFKS